MAKAFADLADGLNQYVIQLSKVPALAFGKILDVPEVNMGILCSVSKFRQFIWKPVQSPCKITGHHHNAAFRFITTVITEHSIISPLDSIF
jgi:hypothetical protein